MKFILLIFFLSVPVLSKAQTYNTGDLNALKTIKANCSPNSVLNWKDAVAVSSWTNLD